MTKSTWLPIAVLAVAVAVMLAWRSRPGPAAATNPSPKVELSEMGPAPALTLDDLNGDSVSLSDYDGKVVLVNLWATWCGWCQKEIPELVDLSDRYAGQGLVVLGVAVDEDGKSVVEPTARDMGITYPVLLDPLGASAQASGLPGGPGIPQSFLIDRQGHLRASIMGYRPGPVVEEAVQKLLAETPG